MFKAFRLISKRLNTKCVTFNRCYAANPKRFYKNTGVLDSNGTFEVTLDNKRLKTPKGEVLKIDNEMLALGVAAEWNAQEGEIHRNTMHLTTLCNTAQDNPNNINKIEAIESIMNFLETDTLLYLSHNDEVSSIQRNEWTPIVNWFCQRFKVNLAPTSKLEGPSITNEMKEIIIRHLNLFNLQSMFGYLLAVESLKSLILTLACVERVVSTNKAVFLSRLEEEFQANKWGRVEWAHNITQYDLQARVSAAIIFVHLNSGMATSNRKSKQ